MLIYNITINIEEDVHDKWLKWMKGHFIPAMLATGKFTQALMSKVLVQEEMGGITYSTQFRTKDRDTLDRYYAENQAEFIQKFDSFKGKAVFFSTEMEVIDQQS